MARVRGRTLVPFRAALKENLGDAGWKRILAELPPADREVLDGLVVPDNWYDRRLHTGISDAAERLFLPGMPDLGKKIGARIASHHDRFYLRPLMRLGGPNMVVRRASGLYRELFQGGSMSVLEARDHGARLQFDDPLATRFFCQETLPGFITALIKLAGREPLGVDSSVCRHRGAPVCELDFEWK